MSLYEKSQPTAQHRFRDTTERQSGQMLNAGYVPGRELCVCCEKLRTRATGIRTAYGFMCHFCSNGGKK